MMAIRERKPPTQCDLRGLINWVAYDNFDGRKEDPLFENKLGYRTRESEAVERAKEDIVDALASAEILSVGRKAGEGTRPGGADWQDTMWKNHSEQESPIPATTWEEAIVDWDKSIVKSERAEFIRVRLTRADAMRLWKPASSPIPASDRAVTLDHNSAPYKDAIDKLDSVIVAIIGDNEYGAKAPEEKEALVSVLRTGRVLLDSNEVKVAFIESTLMPALRYIANNFAQGALQALAAAGVAALIVLLA